MPQQLKIPNIASDTSQLITLMMVLCESEVKMSNFVEYKPMDVEHNVKAAVENLRKAYWSNDTEKVAKIFTEAEDIIVSAICHDTYTVCKSDDERPQGEWENYSADFYKCPECGYLLNKLCPQCYNKVILPKGGREK